MTKQENPQVNFKDPFVIWGAILVGAGVGFGGLIGALLGGLAAAGINKFTKNSAYSQGQKVAISFAITVAAVLVYALVVGSLLSML